MAARTARSVFLNGTRSMAVFRRLSTPQTVKNTVKSLCRTSSSALLVNPALSSVLQSLEKHSSPSFVSHVRRIQDLAINIDANMSVVSTNDGNSQDTLLEQCAEDDDDQFRTKDTLSKVKDEIKTAQLHGNVFAIVHIGGSQFKVTVNDMIMVNTLNAELGSRIRLEKVLLVGGENFTLVGQPLINKNVVDVQATLIENTKTEKVTVFKKKRRKGYKRTQGHRQALSTLRINKIGLNPDSLF